MDLPNTRLWRDDPRPMASSPRFRCPASARLQAIAARFVMTVGAGLQTTSPDHRSTESKSKISVDRKRPIQGLLGMSFLSCFKVTIDTQAVRISNRKTK